MLKVVALCLDVLKSKPSNKSNFLVIACWQDTLIKLEIKVYDNVQTT